MRSKIEHSSLAYWGAAESHLKKLDRIQESAVALLRNPDPSLLPLSLESRREQAAIGFTCKLLDGRGHGMARTSTPEFDDPSAPKPRRSARLAVARPQHLHKLRPLHFPPNSLATFKKCYRARIPSIWYLLLLIEDNYKHTWAIMGGGSNSDNKQFLSLKC